MTGAQRRAALQQRRQALIERSRVQRLQLALAWVDATPRMRWVDLGWRVLLPVLRHPWLLLVPAVLLAWPRPRHLLLRAVGSVSLLARLGVGSTLFRLVQGPSR
jgi:hypothetical protein